MMEVRCCCDAGRLLGWLPNPSQVYHGKSCLFKSGTEVLAFEVAPVTLNWDIQTFAYKSRDYPIESLRKIPEFVEADKYEIEIGENQSLDPRSRRILPDVRTSNGKAECPAVSSTPGIPEDNGRPGTCNSNRGLAVDTRGVHK